MTSAKPNRKSRGFHGLLVACYVLCLSCVLCFPFVAVATVVQSNNCVEGNGVIRSEKRELPSVVSKIQANGAFDIKITIGNTPSLSVEGDENIIPHIQTKVDGDTLYIRTKRSVCTSSPMSISIVIPRLDLLTVAGSNDIDVRGLKHNLMLDVDGSSTVFLSGAVDRLQLSVRGSGDVKAENLKADEVVIKMTGAGDAVVHAVKLLDVTVDGAGTVRYKGNPKLIKKIAGVGDIEPMP